ncbi:MAG: DUF481 domain-containing protein [Phycisphaerales bacterium]|nr:DUF481 domain-containing protein [Phycisphaerales bacterium]
MHIRTIAVLLATLLISCTASGNEPVKLVSGELLEVTSARVDGDSVILDHPILGTMTIPASSIRSINGKPLHAPGTVGTGTAPVQDKNAAAAPTEPEAAKVPKQKVDSDWKGAFTLAGSLNEGTSQNASLFTQLTFTRDTDMEKTSISTFYRFSSAGGETNQSWYNLSANQLWKIKDSKWGIFATGDFDWSEFNTWEQRISAHAGGQYRFFDLSRQTTPTLWVDTLQLDGRIGAGPRKEFAGPETSLVAEGELGGILQLGMGNGQTLAADATYYPALDKNMEYRFDANLNWKIPMHLDGFEGISLALGIKYQFQSEVSSEDKHYDLLGTVGVTWDF